MFLNEEFLNLYEELSQLNGTGDILCEDINDYPNLSAEDHLFFYRHHYGSGLVDLTNKDELLELLNRSAALRQPFKDRSGQIDPTINYYFAVRQLLISANKQNISRAGFKLLTTLLQQLIDEGKLVISKNKEQNNINHISVQRPRNPALYSELALRQVYDYVVKRVYVYLNFQDPLEALKTDKNIAIFGCLDKHLGAGTVEDFKQGLIKYGQKYNVEATVRSFTPEEEEEVEGLYCNGHQIVVELTYTGETKNTIQEEDLERSWDEWDETTDKANGKKFMVVASTFDKVDSYGVYDSESEAEEAAMKVRNKLSNSSVEISVEEI